jgi:hypothetical protein
MGYVFTFNKDDVMDYQEARTAATERMKNAWRNEKPVKAAPPSTVTRNSDAPPTAEEARRAMIEKTENAWRHEPTANADSAAPARENITPENAYQRMIARTQNLYKSESFDGADILQNVPCHS